MEAFGLSVVCTGGGAAAPKRLKEEDEPIAGALGNGCRVALLGSSVGG